MDIRSFHILLYFCLCVIFILNLAQICRVYSFCLSFNLNSLISDIRLNEAMNHNVGGTFKGFVDSGKENLTFK